MNDYEGLRYLIVVLGAGIEDVADSDAAAVTAWTRAGEALKAIGVDPALVDEEIAEELKDLLSDPLG